VADWVGGKVCDPNVLGGVWVMRSFETKFQQQANIL
jgi:hypothetical protein